MSQGRMDILFHGAAGQADMAGYAFVRPVMELAQYQN